MIKTAHKIFWLSLFLTLSSDLSYPMHRRHHPPACTITPPSPSYKCLTDRIPQYIPHDVDGKAFALTINGQSTCYVTGAQVCIPLNDPDNLFTFQDMRCVIKSVLDRWFGCLRRAPESRLADLCNGNLVQAAHNIADHKEHVLSQLEEQWDSSLPLSSSSLLVDTHDGTPSITCVFFYVECSFSRQHFMDVNSIILTFSVDKVAGLNYTESDIAQLTPRLLALAQQWYATIKGIVRTQPQRLVVCSKNLLRFAST